MTCVVKQMCIGPLVTSSQQRHSHSSSVGIVSKLKKATGYENKTVQHQLNVLVFSRHKWLTPWVINSEQFNISSVFLHAFRIMYTCAGSPLQRDILCMENPRIHTTRRASLRSPITFFNHSPLHSIVTFSKVYSACIFPSVWQTYWGREMAFSHLYLSSSVTSCHTLHIAFTPT